MRRYLAFLGLILLACAAHSGKRTQEFQVSGMSCGACAFRVKKALIEEYKGILAEQDIQISFTPGQKKQVLVLSFDPKRLKADQIASYLREKTGFAVEVTEEPKG